MTHIDPSKSSSTSPPKRRNQIAFVDPAASSGTSPTPLSSPHALRVIDAATYLGCAPWFIEELIRAGEIPFRELGKFRVLDADDLESWLARQPKVRVTKIVSGKTFTEKAA